MTTPIVNRPIKFRAWDGKKMFKVGVLNLDGEVAYEDYYWYEGDFSEAADYTETNNGRHSKGVLMQFTGILDSKGVEVYEFDLIKFGEDENIGLVEWGRLSDCCVEGEGWTIRDVDWQNGLNYYTNDNLLEVIGNVFESPELLKE